MQHKAFVILFYIHFKAAEDLKHDSIPFSKTSTNNKLLSYSRTGSEEKSSAQRSATTSADGKLWNLTHSKTVFTQLFKPFFWILEEILVVFIAAIMAVNGFKMTVEMHASDK